MERPVNQFDGISITASGPTFISVSIRIIHLLDHSYLSKFNAIGSNRIKLNSTSPTGLHTNNNYGEVVTIPALGQPLISSNDYQLTPSIQFQTSKIHIGTAEPLTTLPHS